MDQIWAPWRLPYIEDSEPRRGCLFCSIAAEDDDEKNLVVDRESRCFVLLNRYPYNSGHLMIAPYHHTGQVQALETQTGADIFSTTQLAVQALSETLHPEGFNIGVNQGTVAGAGIADHVHVHVVPRWNGDTNFMPVLADAKVIPELLTATADKLRPVFSRLKSAQ